MGFFARVMWRGEPEELVTELSDGVCSSSCSRTCTCDRAGTCEMYEVAERWPVDSQRDFGTGGETCLGVWETTASPFLEVHFDEENTVEEEEEAEEEGGCEDGWAGGERFLPPAPK